MINPYDTTTTRYHKMEIDENISSGSTMIESDRIINLKARISRDIYDYDAYLMLINEFSSMGNMIELRNIRKKMAHNFPLSEDLWIALLKDEIADSENKQDFIIKLFEFAVQDYQSVKIWLEYCQYRMDIMQNRSEIDEIRKLFERAIVNSGLHISEGASIWEGYRDFETSIYQSYLNFSQAQEDEEIKSQLMDQRQRIISLFYRQLAIPHLTLDDTKEAFDFWCQESQESPTHGHTVYKITCQKLNDYIEIEDELVKTDYSYNVFMKYIDLEKKGANPARIISMYERAISKNCLYEKLWLDYIDYLISTIKDLDNLLNVHKRSLRNLMFSSNLWIVYLKTLEYFDRPFEEVKDIFNTAINRRLPYPTDYLYIRVHYGRYIVRSFNKNNDNSQKKLQSCCDYIVNYYQECFSQMSDFGCIVDQNNILIRDLIYVLQFTFRDYPKANTFWKMLISKNPNDASIWMEYFNFLKSYESYKNIRNAYKECLNHKFENPFPIIEKYLQFENLQGDPNSIIEAEKSVQKFHNNYPQQSIQPTSQPLKRHKSFVQPPSKIKKKIEPSMRRVIEQALNSDNIKLQPNVDEIVNKVMDKTFSEGLEDTIQKTNTLSVKNLDPEKLGIKRDFAVFISNIPYTTHDSEISQSFSVLGQISKVYLVRSANGDSKGYGFVQFVNKDSVQKALENDRKIKFDKRRCFISLVQENATERKSTLPHNYNQKLCLYVSKIHPEISEQEITQLFDKTEGFQECRLATYRNGNSRGFAYVQYTSEDFAKKALVLLDGTILKDKPIAIHMSDPPKKKEETKPITQHTHIDIQSENPKIIEKKNYSNEDFRKLLKKKQ